MATVYKRVKSDAEALKFRASVLLKGVDPNYIDVTSRDVYVAPTASLDDVVTIAAGMRLLDEQKRQANFCRPVGNKEHRNIPVNIPQKLRDPGTKLAKRYFPQPQLSMAADDIFVEAYSKPIDKKALPPLAPVDQMALVLYLTRNRK